jgi:hypothetical protein
MQILKGKLYATLNDTLVIYKPPTGPTQFTCVPKKTTIIALEDYNNKTIHLEVLTEEGLKGYIQNPENKLTILEQDPAETV